MEYGARLSELIVLLLKVWKILLEADPGKVAICSFFKPDNPAEPMLRQASQFPNKAPKIDKIYTQALKLSWAPYMTSTEVHFLVAHATPIADILESQQVSSKLEE